MRVIAGTYKGRQLKSPHGHRTHPMAEKIRGALFNVLGDIADLTILDAFAGGGALSVEAISRGAKNAVAIDNDKHAIRALKDNIEQLGLLAQIKSTDANVSGWSDNNSLQRFDIVLIDPPFNDVKPALLQKLAQHAKKGGVVAFSLPPRTDIELPDDYDFLMTKNYGDAQLVFYRKKTEESKLHGA
jgi:16S rRNA (guanine966-N2)-methyltransferase